MLAGCHQRRDRRLSARAAVQNHGRVVRLAGDVERDLPGRIALANPSWARTSLRGRFHSLGARYRTLPRSHTRSGLPLGRARRSGVGRTEDFASGRRSADRLADGTPFDFNTEQQQIHQHLLGMRTVRQLDHRRSRLQSDERLSPQRATQRRRNRLRSVACCFAPTNMTRCVPAASHAKHCRHAGAASQAGSSTVAARCVTNDWTQCEPTISLMTPHLREPPRLAKQR